MLVVVTVPGLRVQSNQNLREHWRKRAKRSNEHKACVLAALMQVGSATRRALQDAPRVNVKLIRLGGRKLDRDNLAGGFKHVLDGLCQWLGVDDSDEDRLGLEWSQEPGGEYGVRIELSYLED